MRGSIGCTTGWILAGLTALAGPSKAQCTAPLSSFLARGESIGVIAGDGVDAELIDEAVELWRACGNYAAGFPQLLAQRQGTRTVRVEMERRNSRGPYCGTFSGSSIRLFAFYMDRNGKPQRCARPALNLAHELGHVLGLDDAPSGTVCQESIMAPLTVLNASRRWVSAEECSLVGQKWITPVEEVRLAAIGDVDPYELTAARFAAGTAGSVVGLALGHQP